MTFFELQIHIGSYAWIHRTIDLLAITRTYTPWSTSLQTDKCVIFINVGFLCFLIAWIHRTIDLLAITRTYTSWSTSLPKD